MHFHMHGVAYTTFKQYSLSKQKYASFIWDQEFLPKVGNTQQQPEGATPPTSKQPWQMTQEEVLREADEVGA